MSTPVGLCTIPHTAQHGNSGPNTAAHSPHTAALTLSLSLCGHRARLGPAGQRVSDREVTAIVYLNTGWGSAQQHGGYLRIHPPHGGPPTDVAPVAGRLVLFQSRSVEHEVLPAWRTRWAVSAWLPSRAAFAA